MRILYLGLPLGADVLRRSGFEPLVLGIGHLDAPGRRRLARHAPGLLLGQPDLHDPEVVRALESTKPDVLLSWFWPRRIPAAVLALPGLGAYGVHPSLLPRWRGPDPYFWAIRAGDRETGVTLHHLGAEYDTGDVIETRPIAIRPEENAWQLARRLDRPSLALLVSAARRLASGASLPGTPQDDALATPAPRPTEDDLTIDWSEDAASIARLVRASAPAPGASALFEDALVTIESAALSTDRPPGGLGIGEAWRASGGRVLVRCAEDALEVRRVRIEDAEGVAAGSVLSGPDIGRLLDSGD